MPSLKPSLPVNRPRRTGIVLTSDDQLREYSSAPEKPVKNHMHADKSLSQICDDAVNKKQTVLTFFHDHFFGGGERKLHLTHPEFIDCTRKMSEYAESRGLGIGASVTNPLDLGRTFKTDMGVGGQHRFFSEGIRSEDGNFSFNAMMSERWCNNKGYVYPEFDRARLFTYTEKQAGAYLVIDPASIKEIPASDYTLEVSRDEYELSTYFGNRHMVISGKTSLPGNRVFAVLYMDTPEMDYFHPQITEYVHGIIDMYRKQGVEFMELYSDEMHIQFDWDFDHFGPYEIPTRYMTENFQNTLAKADPLFADFDIALIYFGYDMLCDRKALGIDHTQHVLGTDAASLRRTFALRSTYYETLQDKVVGMCCESRDYIRSTYVKHKGYDPLCLGHATWQESPTCDQYGKGRKQGMFNDAVRNGICAYDYTKDYVYSSTVREAISGCYDYFKWNDYFSYGGNDFCECGWFDRNYYGGAMAASLGALNRNEVASWGAWGFPAEIRKRFNKISSGFGALSTYESGIMCYGRPRIVDVLYLYPKHLTSVEERFGSWMVQSGYVNYCPADRVVNLGKVENGTLKLGLGNYSTIVAAFEPYYDEKLLSLLEEFVSGGGRVVWCSTPPAKKDGTVPARWLKDFGLVSVQSLTEGGTAEKVTFCGSLSYVHPMNIPTDYLPDRIYTAVPMEGSEILAKANGSVIGVKNGGFVFIGCRLRDDQSGDTGDAPKTLFDVLKALGAYGGAACFDNTETLSRTTPYFVTKFANGAVAVCPHTYPLKELWDGPFARDDEKDAALLKDYDYKVPLQMKLAGLPVEGHRIGFEGGSLKYVLTADGSLQGFSGENTCGITVDGKPYTVTKENADTAFNVIEPARIPDGYKGGWTVTSTATDVDICTAIPANAEIYFDADKDGLNLVPDASLSFKGSVVHLGDKNAAVILYR